MDFANIGFKEARASGLSARLPVKLPIRLWYANASMSLILNSKFKIQNYMDIFKQLPEEVASEVMSLAGTSEVSAVAELTAFAATI